MSEEAARKMDGVVPAGSGLRGRDGQAAYRRGKKRYKIELENLPGKYRVYGAGRRLTIRTESRKRRDLRYRCADVSPPLRTGNRELMRHFIFPGSPQVEASFPDAGQPLRDSHNGHVCHAVLILGYVCGIATPLTAPDSPPP